MTASQAVTDLVVTLCFLTAIAVAVGSYLHHRRPRCTCTHYQGGGRVSAIDCPIHGQVA